MVESPRIQQRRRTFALAIVIAAYALSFFQRFAPAGIASDLAAAFNTSASSLGALAATYFYVYTILFKRVFTTRLRDNNDRDDLEMELGT